MKIGILSDTHDQLNCLKAALAFFEKEGCRAIIHAGDIVAPFSAQALREWPEQLFICYGNNDGERLGLKKVLPNIVSGPVTIVLDGRTIVFAHEKDRLTPACYEKAQVVIYGHTHKPLVENKNGRLWINPGETCGWTTGNSTVAILETSDLSCEIHEI